MMGGPAVDVFVFLFGSIIGSFLNVCIVRMPKGESVVAPRSHCGVCQRLIPWYDNIPLVSYFLLRGRCRSCGSRFSFRYVFVELLTAAAFLGLYRSFGWSGQTLAYCVMVSCFIVATFVDFGHRIIPDEISVGGMFAGLALSAVTLELHEIDPSALGIGRVVMRVFVLGCLAIHAIDFLIHRRAWEREDRILLSVIGGLFVTEAVLAVLAGHPGMKAWEGYLASADASVIGLLLGGGIIYAMGLLGDVIFQKESMGGGDVKLMALIGAFLGWKLAVVTFFVAPFFGAGYGIVEKIRTRDSAIAYGPFLVLGALVSLFWGPEIIAWVMGQYGYAPAELYGGISGGL